MKNLLCTLIMVLFIPLSAFAEEPPTGIEIEHQMKKYWMNSEFDKFEAYILELNEKYPNYVPAIAAKAAYYDAWSMLGEALNEIKRLTTFFPYEWSSEEERNFIEELYGREDDLELRKRLFDESGKTQEELAAMNKLQDIKKEYLKLLEEFGETDFMRDFWLGHYPTLIKNAPSVFIE